MHLHLLEAEILDGRHPEIIGCESQVYPPWGELQWMHSHHLFTLSVVTQFICARTAVVQCPVGAVHTQYPGKRTETPVEVTAKGYGRRSEFIEKGLNFSSVQYENGTEWDIILVYTYHSQP